MSHARLVASPSPLTTKGRQLSVSITRSCNSSINVRLNHPRHLSPVQFCPAEQKKEKDCIKMAKVTFLTLHRFPDPLRCKFTRNVLDVGVQITLE